MKTKVVSTIAKAIPTPYGIAVDFEGNVFVSSSSGIRKITPDGVTSILLPENTHYSVAHVAINQLQGIIYFHDNNTQNIYKVYGATKQVIYALYNQKVNIDYKFMAENTVNLPARESTRAVNISQREFLLRVEVLSVRCTLLGQLINL